MKKYLILLALFALTLTAGAAGVRLTWDANPPGENVTGYKIYWNTSSQNYSEVTPDTIGNRTSHVVFGLEPSTTYYFIVTAYNVAGESGPSEEVSITTSALPSAVLNLRIQGQQPDPQ